MRTSPRCRRIPIRLRRMVEVGDFVRADRLDLKKVVDGRRRRERAADRETRKQFLTAMTRIAQDRERSWSKRSAELASKTMTRDDRMPVSAEIGGLLRRGREAPAQATRQRASATTSSIVVSRSSPRAIACSEREPASSPAASRLELDELRVLTEQSGKRSAGGKQALERLGGDPELIDEAIEQQLANSTLSRPARGRRRVSRGRGRRRRWTSSTRRR